MLRLAETVSEELWFGDPDPERGELDASRSLAAHAGRATGLRPFPATAAEVLSLLRRPDYAMGKLEGLITSDASLASRFLSVANSAVYRRLSPCNTVRAALVRLGSQSVRDVVAGIATMSMFADVNGTGVGIRNHSAGVAAIGRTLAYEWRLKEAEQLFLCGLLHDVGKLLLLQSGDNFYDGPTGDVADQVHLQERKKLGYDHAVLGAHVLEHWKIPAPVPQIVAWHHQPARAFQLGGTIGVMVALLRVADEIEYQLRRETKLDEAFVEGLARQGAASYVGFEASDLRAVWSLVVDARAEIVAILR
jgi:putative nucleotidyltransferase with HDIG domain